MVSNCDYNGLGVSIDLVDICDVQRRVSEWKFFKVKAFGVPFVGSCSRPCEFHFEGVVPLRRRCRLHISPAGRTLEEGIRKEFSDFVVAALCICFRFPARAAPNLTRSGMVLIYVILHAVGRRDDS